MSVGAKATGTDSVPQLQPASWDVVAGGKRGAHLVHRSPLADSIADEITGAVKRGYRFHGWRGQTSMSANILAKLPPRATNLMEGPAWLRAEVVVFLLPRTIFGPGDQRADLGVVRADRALKAGMVAG